ncbi:MAG: hypothetical protein ACTH8J_09335 [Specibacter sp.]
MIEEVIVQFAPDGKGSKDGFALHNPYIGARQVASHPRGLRFGVGNKYVNESAERPKVPENFQGQIRHLSVGTLKVKSAVRPGGMVLRLKSDKGSAKGC